MKIKLSSDGGDSGSEKCKLGYGGAYCLEEVCSQAVGFVLMRLAATYLQSP
jgi:hypothetical protein